MTDPTTPLSLGNGRVKDARRLSRRSERTERRLFLADGPNSVAEALLAPGCVVEVFATAQATERWADLAAQAPRWSVVEDRALEALSDSRTPAGLVAVCHQLDQPDLETVLAGNPQLLVICAQVRDPGNAGTVVRTADAAGADAVVLADEAVDLYHPRTVRASVGSIFHLPVLAEADAASVVRRVRGSGMQVLAAAGDGEVCLDEPGQRWARPTAWLLGNEAHGLPEDLAALADHRVRIPIHGRAESLNLSTAAALCLYATAAAQRRVDGEPTP